MSFIKKIYEAFTGNERRAFWIAATIASASLVVVAGIFLVTSTHSVPAAGGTFTEGVVGQPEYVNPVNAKSEADLDLMKLVYQNIPAVAQSVTPSSDGKTWTVRLKEGLTWQDGQKLTSDDVVFTVQAIQDPDANSPLAAAWQGITASRTSELEVQFSLMNPSAFFGNDLSNLYVAPKHLFIDVPVGNWRFSEYNLKPIGSGPYEFSSYQKQFNGFIETYSLKTWNGYIGSAPLIQNFDFTFFRNKSDLLKEFNTAQIDGFSADLSDLAGIDRPYNVNSWRTPAYYAVFWNQSKNIALQDSAVRTALAQAVDRSALVTDALKDFGKPDTSPVPPNAPYATEIDQSSSIDIASATLSAAHWTLSDNGVRVKSSKKSSTTLAFTLTVPDIDFLVKTARDLQSVWAAIGAQVSIATDATENMANQEVPNRDYDALLFGNVLGVDSNLRSFWHSSERFAPGLNLSLYSSSAADKLITSIPGIMDDGARTTAFAKLQNTIANDQPAIFLYSPNSIYVSDKKAQGITTDFIASPSDRLLEVPAWYLNTARVLK